MKGFNKLFIFFLLISLFLPAEENKKSSIFEPVIKEPVLKQEKQELSTIKKKVKISYQNKQWLKGEIELNSNLINKYKFDKISSIEVKSYRKNFLKKIKDKNLFICIPCNWFIIYQNGDEIFINNSIKSLQKIEVSIMSKKQTAYFYFYHYEQFIRLSSEEKVKILDRKHIEDLIPADTAVKINLY